MKIKSEKNEINVKEINKNKIFEGLNNQSKQQLGGYFQLLIDYNDNNEN
jgi:hypothetical protein